MVKVKVFVHTTYADTDADAYEATFEYLLLKSEIKWLKI